VIVMELRSSHATKSDGEDRSKTNVKAVSGSGSGTSSGAWNRKSGSAMSSKTTSSSGRRASPTKHQVPSKPSLCSNNEHCSKNNTAVAQRDNATLQDGTNGQVMSDPGNGPPSISASSAHSRQRDVLLYDFFFCVLL